MPKPKIRRHCDVEGWVELEDANTGKVYYANIVTKATKWTPPTQEDATPTGGDVDRKDKKSHRNESDRASRASSRSRSRRHQNATDTESVAKSIRDGTGSEKRSGSGSRSSKRDTSNAPDANGLPEGWKAKVDSKSGRTYYVNLSTKATTWKRPDNAPSSASQSSSKSGRVQHGDWVKTVDKKSGRPYFVNVKTKESRWKPPAGWVEPDQQPPVNDPPLNAAIAATADAPTVLPEPSTAPGSTGQAQDDTVEDVALEDIFGDGVQSGVGLFPEVNPARGTVLVKNVFSGSAAARNGNIRVGDELLEVDGEPCAGKTASQIRAMLVGPQGSYARLSLIKANSEERVDVRLLRGSAEALANLASKGLELHAEVNALTDSLRLVEQQLDDERAARREESSRAAAVEESIRNGMQEEMDRLRAQMDKEQKLRKEAQLRERRLLDDRLAEALEEGGSTDAAREEIQRLAEQLKETQRRLREAEERMASPSKGHSSSREVFDSDDEGMPPPPADDKESTVMPRTRTVTGSSREEELLQQLEDERFRWGEALRLEEQRIRLEEAAMRDDMLSNEAKKAEETMRDAVQQERRRAEQEIMRLQQALDEAEKALAEAGEREKNLIEQIRRVNQGGSGAADSALKVQLDAERRRREDLERQLAGVNSRIESVQQQQTTRIEAAKERLSRVPGPPEAQQAAPNSGLFQQPNPLPNFQQQQTGAPTPGSTNTAPSGKNTKSVPALVALLTSNIGNSVREAVYALGLVAIEADGRKALTQVPNALPKLAALLQSPDVATARYATLAIGNIALDEPGRRGIMAVPGAVSCLVNLLRHPDVETTRFASLAVGNLVLELQGRQSIIAVPNALQYLAQHLRSQDKHVVRYSTGAIRNLAVEPQGRQAIRSIPEAASSLGMLQGSSDPTTARYAAAAVKNLAMA